MPMGVRVTTGEKTAIKHKGIVIQTAVWVGTCEEYTCGQPHDGNGAHLSISNKDVTCNV